jgi:hypothetical protein
VTRLLTGLEADGHVRRQGRHLLLLDPSRLAAVFGLGGEV